MMYGYARARTAQGAISPCRFVKPGTTPFTGLQAAAETDPIIGVSLEFNNPQAGQRFDFAVIGPTKIELGGTVADGDLLTSDSEGRGITATRHTHTENTAAAYAQNATTAAAPVARVGAMALSAGVLGEFIDVIVLPILG
jgi:hypothetical protein